MAKEEKTFEVAKAYEAYNNGALTINDIADESGLDAQEVAALFEQHVQANKGKTKEK